MKRKKKYKKVRVRRSLKDKFKQKHGYQLNLAHPRTLSEKIQWIKKYGKLERFSSYVDKFAVRQFVKETIGEEYLIPQLGVYDCVEEIHWSSLPESFVMKTTHASGWNIIVKEKTKINWEDLKIKMKKWLTTSYFRKYGEANYRNIKPRVVIEELIKDPSGDLKDYKIFCFNGEPKFIQVDGDRFTDHKRDFYDLSWNKIPVGLKYKNFSQPVTKPESLEEMINIAQKLSAIFAFVRVDLYFVEKRILFGELTFTPGNGFEPFKPCYYDEFFGQYLDLTWYRY